MECLDGELEMLILSTLAFGKVLHQVLRGALPMVVSTVALVDLHFQALGDQI